MPYFIPRGQKKYFNKSVVPDDSNMNQGLHQSCAANNSLQGISNRANSSCNFDPTHVHLTGNFSLYARIQEQQAPACAGTSGPRQYQYRKQTQAASPESVGTKPTKRGAPKRRRSRRAYTRRPRKPQIAVPAVGDQPKRKRGRPRKYPRPEEATEASAAIPSSGNELDAPAVVAPQEERQETSPEPRRKQTSRLRSARVMHGGQRIVARLADNRGVGEGRRERGGQEEAICDRDQDLD